MTLYCDISLLCKVQDIHETVSFCYATFRTFMKL